MMVGDVKGAKQVSMERRHSVEQMQSLISGLVWDRSNHAASPSMTSCHTMLWSGCRQTGTCCALSMHSQEGQVSESAKPQSFIILFTPQNPLMCFEAQSWNSGGYRQRVSPLATWSKSAAGSFGGLSGFSLARCLWRAWLNTWWQMASAGSDVILISAIQHCHPS